MTHYSSILMALIKSETSESKLKTERPSSCGAQKAVNFDLTEYSELLLSPTTSPSTSSQDKSYECNLCGRKCRHYDTLTNHIRTHTGEKPFKCNECEFMAAQESTLRAHQLLHKLSETTNNGKNLVEEDDILRFQCGHCTYRTLHKGHLNRHLLIHTQSAFLECHVGGCTYKTREKENLVRHYDVRHNPQKKLKFRCPLCPFKFYANYELQRHLVFHTKEKLFQCSACEYRSARDRQLRIHIRLRHRHKGPRKDAKRSSGPAKIA